MKKNITLLWVRKTSIWKEAVLYIFWWVLIAVILCTFAIQHFYPLAFQAEEVLSLPASVRLSVRLSVRPSVCPSVRKLYPDLQGHFGHFDSSQIWARITTKFAPNMHAGIFMVGIENGGHWPWPSRPWPFWLRILRKLACLWDKTSQIWARITKFAPSMHHGILPAGIENGGHWPCPSRSFWPFWLGILGNLACLHHNL